MHLEAFIDFYYLEALASAPLDMMRKPQEKLKLESVAYFKEFCDNFALAIRDYLYIACFGEARHARVKASKYWPGNLSNYSRSRSYRLAAQYQPEEALPLLYKLFENYPWSGSYGGKKWAQIAKTTMLYGKIPNAVFIDEAANLQHWNGFVFSKFEAKLLLDWNFDGNVYGALKDWLNFKAITTNILHIPDISILPGKISSKTQSLIIRYYNVSGIETPLPKWWSQHPTFKGNPYTYKPFKFNNTPIPKLLIPSNIQYKHYVKNLPEFSTECACLVCDFKKNGKTFQEATKSMKAILTEHKAIIESLEKEIKEFNGQKEKAPAQSTSSSTTNQYTIANGTT